MKRTMGNFGLHYYSDCTDTTMITTTKMTTKTTAKTLSHYDDMKRRKLQIHGQNIAIVVLIQ